MVETEWSKVIEPGIGEVKERKKKQQSSDGGGGVNWRKREKKWKMGWGR